MGGCAVFVLFKLDIIDPDDIDYGIEDFKKPERNVTLYNKTALNVTTSENEEIDNLAENKELTTCPRGFELKYG